MDRPLRMLQGLPGMPGRSMQASGCPCRRGVRLGVRGAVAHSRHGNTGMSFRLAEHDELAVVAVQVGVSARVSTHLLAPLGGRLVEGCQQAKLAHGADGVGHAPSAWRSGPAR